MSPLSAPPMALGGAALPGHSRAPRGALRRLPGTAKLALGIVAALWIVAALSPLASKRAAEIRLAERLAPPSAAHPFGTDDLGRDLFARVVVATPLSLAIGTLAAALSFLVGFSIGAAAGWSGV